MKNQLSVVGLFAGIGGVERGLAQAGHRATMLCEIDDGASRVLARRFPGVELRRDVCEIESLPAVDLVTAGFPCQDLSQAGRTAGIKGKRSGLVGEVFRLIKKPSPRWLLLENVPFMLSLDRGAAMNHLVTEIEDLGYRWAYRVVDSRSFGLPQRRRRVLFLASKKEDPASVLFSDEAGQPRQQVTAGVAKGFYWTEGTRGLGWAIDAVPTLKSGSTLGIPSPPAIWMPNEDVVTPDIRDAERLQGFDADWTKCWSEDSHRLGPRWKMVGNAVSVPVAKWVGMRLATNSGETAIGHPMTVGPRWPKAAFGSRRGRFEIDRSEWPCDDYGHGLAKFLQYPGKPLSAKATSGFLTRATASRLRFEDRFIESLKRHLNNQQRDEKKSAKSRSRK